MKTGLLVALLTLPTALNAHAFEHRTPAAKQLYACETRGLLRIATKVDSGGCCVGQLRCVQYLATRSIIKPGVDVGEPQHAVPMRRAPTLERHVDMGEA